MNVTQRIWRICCGWLPESWIAPHVRELRELVRHRAKLVSLRTGLKCSVHAVLAKCGITVPMSDLFGVAGQRMLQRLRLAPAYQARIASLRRLINACDKEIDVIAKAIGYRVAQVPGWKAIQAIDGVGPTLAAVLVAEIGDVTRFARPDQLCSWAGLTPRHRESDTKVRRGRITKQGNRLVRWACIEAVQRIRGGPCWAPGRGWPTRGAAVSPRSPAPVNCSPWSTTT
jgi:transposase